MRVPMSEWAKQIATEPLSPSWKPRIVVRPQVADVVETVARDLEILVADALELREVFALALSGGSTPGALYDKLSSPDYRDHFAWSRIRFFLGDERAVPRHDVLSNYAFAHQRLLRPLGLRKAQANQWVTETDNLEMAAREYEAQLMALGNPLDLTLLGLGDDGHTASLFPHSPQLTETDALCVATPVSSLTPFVRRLTFTYKAINHSQNVWFLVTGEDKAEAVRAALSTGDVADIPARGVRPLSGQLTWYLDEAAAKLL